MGFTPNFTLSSYYVVDISLPSSELVFGLINHDNNSSFTANDIFFDLPTASAAGSLRNSNVTVYRQPPYDYDSMVVAYDRLDLDEALEKQLPIILSLEADESTQSELVEYLNTTYGLGLIADEILGGEIDPTLDTNTFAISSTSLAWQGSIEFTAIAYGQSLMVDDAGQYMATSSGLLLEITPPPTSE